MCIHTEIQFLLFQCTSFFYKTKKNQSHKEIVDSPAPGASWWFMFGPWNRRTWHWEARRACSLGQTLLPTPLGIRPAGEKATVWAPRKKAIPYTRPAHAPVPCVSSAGSRSGPTVWTATLFWLAPAVQIFQRKARKKTDSITLKWVWLLVFSRSWMNPLWGSKLKSGAWKAQKVGPTISIQPSRHSEFDLGHPETLSAGEQNLDEEVFVEPSPGPLEWLEATHIQP